MEGSHGVGKLPTILFKMVQWTNFIQKLEWNFWMAVNFSLVVILWKQTNHLKCKRGATLNGRLKFGYNFNWISSSSALGWIHTVYFYYLLLSLLILVSALGKRLKKKGNSVSWTTGYQTRQFWLISESKLWKCHFVTLTYWKADGFELLKFLFDHS